MELKQIINCIDGKINQKKGEISRLVQAKQLLLEITQKKPIDNPSITGTPEELAERLVEYHSHIGRPLVVKPEILDRILASSLPSRKLSENLKKDGITISSSAISLWRRRFNHIRNWPKNRPICPRCSSKDLISKGFIHHGKSITNRIWFCKSCKRRFIDKMQGKIK